jgi:hypothetical protein
MLGGIRAVNNERLSMNSFRPLRGDQKGSTRDWIEHFAPMCAVVFSCLVYFLAAKAARCDCTQKYSLMLVWELRSIAIAFIVRVIEKKKLSTQFLREFGVQ